MGTGSGAGSERDEELEVLYQDVEDAEMAPFWATNLSEAHDEDRQVMDNKKAIPFAWKYRTAIEPLLRRSAELVTTESSERRSLILVNPSLKPRRATVSTMYTAYRLNDPREVMPPHRHSPSAIRFGLTGKMNFTGVDGENITFGPGDMVLTPGNTWHNHGNQGSEPAVNLSVLDVPLVDTLNATRFEHDYTELEGGHRVRRSVQTERVPSDYSQRVYSAGGLLPRFTPHRRGGGTSSPMYVYRWETVREVLDKFKDWGGDSHEAISIEYVDPTTGGPVFRTMTFFMQMLRPGEHTLPLWQNANLLYAPFQGHGYSCLGGKRIEWEPFDTVAIPGGTWCEHVNLDESQPAIIFVASDEPTLKALGLYRKLGRVASGETTVLF